MNLITSKVGSTSASMRRSSRVRSSRTEWGRSEGVNPAFARMHGYLVDDLIGQPLSVVGPPERVRSNFVKGFSKLPVRVHPWS